MVARGSPPRAAACAPSAFAGVQQQQTPTHKSRVASAVTKAGRLIARRASFAASHDGESDAPLCALLPPVVVIEMTAKDFKKLYRLPGDAAMIQSLSKAKPLKPKTASVAEKLILDIFETCLRLEFKKHTDGAGKVPWARVCMRT